MSGTAPSLRPGSQLFGARSRQGFVLGPQIARGGEGTVFALQGKPGLLAKIYHKGLDNTKVHKLNEMIGQRCSVHRGKLVENRKAGLMRRPYFLGLSSAWCCLSSGC